MPWFAVGGALIGGISSIFGGSSAADAQRDAAVNAARADEKKFQQIRSDFAPYRESGASANATYADLIGLNGPERQAAAYQNFRSDPSYQYAMDQGIDAIQSSAAAGSLGIGGGGVLRALQRHGQGLQNQQYGTYLQRFMDASNQGLNAAAQTGASANQAAARQGQYTLDAGAARAGGYLSMANGVNGAISNGLNLYGYMRGNNGGGGGGGIPDWSGVSGPQTTYRGYP